MAEEMTTLKNEGEEELITQTELMQKNIGTELVEKAVSGDEEAFEQLYMLSYRYVFAVARHYLKRDEDIYDAIQDTYTRVYKNLSKLNEPEAFAYWLRKIAENCSKTVRDRKRVDSDLELFEAEFVSGEDELRHKDVELDITEVLLALDPEDAELLTRIYYDKLTIAEIARTKELPDSTVRSRVKAAEKRLRELLRVRGIEKPFYGGEFVAMITTAFRNAIGTDLLSATVAQEILDNIRGGDKKRGAVIGAVATKERNKAVLRLAGVLVATAIFFALLIFGIFKIADAIENRNKGANGRGNGEKTPFFEAFFGGNSSEDTSSDESSSTAEVPSKPSNTSDNSSNDESSSISSNSSSDNSWDTPSNNTSTTSSDSSSDNSSVFVPGYTPPETDVGFAPDCDESEFNTVGTTTWNTDARIAKQADWIYYSTEDTIYKVKEDGSRKTKLADERGNSMNVLGEYIYFVSRNGYIERMLTNGSDRAVIYESKCHNLQIRNGKMYFAAEVDYFCYNIMSIDMKTGEIKGLASGVKSIEFVVTDKELIYLTGYETGLWGLLAKNLSTGRVEAIQESAIMPLYLVTDKEIIVQNEYGEIYVYDVNTYEYLDCEEEGYRPEIYLPTDGGVTYIYAGHNRYFVRETREELTKLYAWSEDYLATGKVTTFDDGYIYYVDSKGTLHRCKPGGGSYKIYN